MMFLMLTSTVVRSLHKSIHVRIIRTVHHQNVAGLALTGTFVTFYIVACDACAFYYAYIGHNEISHLHELKRTINFISTGLLLAFDGMVCLIPLTVLLYVCCKYIDEQTYRAGAERQNNCNKCVRGCFLGNFLHQGFKLYFNAIFGTLNLTSLWDSEDEKVKGFRLVWIITLSLVAPLFAISSHITFILVSWLTNKTQASSVALICLAVITFLFFMFRQCYTAVSASKRIKEWPPCLYPFCQCGKHISACFFLSCCCWCNRWNKLNRCREWMEKGDPVISKRLAIRSELNLDEESTVQVEEVNLLAEEEKEKGGASPVEVVKKKPKEGKKLNRVQSVLHEQEDHQYKEFNTRAFCIVFMWGWVLVGMVGLVIVAFMLLPIVAFDLLTDLINTFQITLILVGVLITYKILSLSEPDIYRFLNVVRKAFLTKSEADGKDVTEKVSDLKRVDDIEATGYLVGELAEVVVHRLPQVDTLK